ncbi:MAG: magnesium transporter [Candidatus Magasanikbacteria bacterium]|nr:magnesium transporter [Candidatus Magasanikbacteria bacterium]
MLYLSELLKRPIRDSSDTKVGRLIDVVVAPVSGEYPPLLFLLMEERRTRRRFFISYAYVANVSREEITLKHLFKTIPEGIASEGDVWLSRDILDEQIVDVEGARVVRVNDLRLGSFENELCVLGIDVSFKGILRRLGMGRLDIFDLWKVNLIDWRNAQLVKGVLKLDTILKDLVKIHPADLANIVEDLSLKQGSRLVRSLDAKAAAHVLEEMDPHIQKTLIHYLGPERAAKIVEQMSVDETVDLLKMLPREEAKEFLSYLQGSKLTKVKKLISYPEDSAGGLMTTEHVAARPEWTVLQTIDEVRRLSPRLRSLVHVYITDVEGLFKGSVSLRRLLLASSGEALRTIMKRLPRHTVLKIDDPINKVIKIMTKYDLYTAAVLDKDHKFVGVVTIDDVMRHLVPNA